MPHAQPVSPCPAFALAAPVAKSGHRPGFALRLLLALLLSLMLPLLASCQHFVWDPTKRIGSVEGHRIADRAPDDEAEITPLRPEDDGIAIAEELTDQRRPFQVGGTGTFVRRVSPPQVDTTPGDVTLNFEGTDIREVVKVILGDLLGVNYVLDPGVQGTVSLQTGRPLRRDLLIPTLETLLRMNNAALVDSAGTYEVIPLGNAVQGRMVPQLGETARALPDGFSVQVVPLQYIGAEEMANILQPLAPDGSVVRVDNLRNLVVLAGTSPEMGNLLETIRVFDVDWMAGLSVGFFTLEYARATEVVTQIQTLLGEEDSGPLRGLFRFIPIESSNALLVVSPQQGYLTRMGEWISRLDMAEATGSTQQRLFVYRVRHGDAENLADVLSKLFSGEGSGAERRSVGGVAPGLRQATIGDGGGEGMQTGTDAPRPAVASQLELSAPVSIVADSINNSLLVRSSPRDYKRILDALKQLDILPLQVLVEATIVEITLRGELRYGVQWRFLGPAKDDYRGDISLRQSPAGPQQTFPGFNWSIVLRPDTIRATLAALASDNLINVLSSPSVMVRDNQTAKIQVGEQVPIATTQQQGTTDIDRVINQIQYRDTGVMLSVRPRVTPGGLVQMEIEQEVSTVAAETGPLNSPTFRTRNITSNVAVRSNQAVVLGGLIQDGRDEGKTGVPGLYRTPFIGGLFGETSRRAERTELVVVLTPRVIASDGDIETVTADFRRKVRNLDVRF
ncbi:MAG: type II secretion system protein GspD [Chromatiaceae bacterium]|nr:MAG: type II secretion system protein GspD [Chromatiaceae bacterium]